MRKIRKVVAINVATGQRKEFAGTYQAAKALETSTQNIALAMDRCGICRGWKLYDSPESLREKIEELKKRIKEIEK